jgi:hypothetical protein
MSGKLDIEATRQNPLIAWSHPGNDPAQPAIHSLRPGLEDLVQKLVRKSVEHLVHSNMNGRLLERSRARRCWVDLLLKLRPWQIDPSDISEATGAFAALLGRGDLCEVLKEEHRFVMHGKKSARELSGDEFARLLLIEFTIQKIEEGHASLLPEDLSQHDTEAQD